jgi:uncharacterized membrane protein YdbT with pleckstrin-like domain
MKKIREFLLKRIKRIRGNKIILSLFACPSFLLPEERVIFKTNPHWLCVVFPEVCLAFSGVILLSYLSYPLPEQFFFIYSPWLLVFFEMALVFVIIVIYFQWFCIRYYLTNMRLIEERGIIGKRMMNIWLQNVQDVTCKYGILGRIFGFGDLEIESAGTYGKIIFSFLPAPKRLRQKIEEAIQEFRQLKAKS